MSSASVPTPSGTSVWKGVAFSAPNYVWRPPIPSEPAARECGVLVGMGIGTPCPTRWTRSGSSMYSDVLVATLPAVANVTFTFQGAGVRVQGVSFDPCTLLAVLDNNQRAAQTVSIPRVPRELGVVAQFEGLNPNIQHSLYLDASQSPHGTAGLGRFEVLQVEASTVVESQSSTTASLDGLVYTHQGSGVTSSGDTTPTKAPDSVAHAPPAQNVVPAAIASGVIGLLLVLAAVTVLLRLRKRKTRTRARVDLTGGHNDSNSKRPTTPRPGRASKLGQLRLWAKRAASPPPSEGDAADAEAVIAFATSLRRTMRRMGLPVEGLRAALPQVLQDMEEQETLPDYEG